MKKSIVLGVALLLLGTSSSVSAVTGANVDSTQGSVDVTPLGATESADGNVTYSYQVSLLQCCLATTFKQLTLLR